MTELQPKLNSYTGAYVMYISEGSVVITGNERFKNFKALFPVSEVRDFIAPTTTSAEKVLEKLEVEIYDRYMMDKNVDIPAFYLLEWISKLRQQERVP